MLDGKNCVRYGIGVCATCLLAGVLSGLGWYVLSSAALFFGIVLLLIIFGGKIVVPPEKCVLVRRSFFFRKSRVYVWPKLIVAGYHDYCLVDLGEKEILFADSNFQTANGSFQIIVRAVLNIKDDDDAIIALAEKHGREFSPERIRNSFRIILEDALRKSLDSIHGFKPEKTNPIGLRAVQAISNYCKVETPTIYALHVELEIEKLEQNS